MTLLSTRPSRWRSITVFNLLVGLLFSLSAMAQPAFLTNGLVAYYQFSSDANDASGNGKNGQINGVQFAGDRLGSGTGSAVFNANGYISIPEVSTTLGQPKSSFTVSLWVKPSAKSSNHFISATTDNSYQFCRVESLSDYRVKIYHRGSGQNNEPVGNIQLKPEQWNSVIYKTDGPSGVGSVYINGVIDPGLNFNYDSSVNYYQANRNWALGTTLNTTCGGCNPYYQGGLDDVRIYNRALSDAEVKALYDYESAPPKATPRIASATAQVVNGFVVGATVTDAGFGYVSNPAVTITGGGGSGARATATQVNGVVTSITITNPGIGYTSVPTITIAPPPFPPRKSTGTAQIVNGFVVGAQVSDGGFGYDAPPAVLLVGGGGSGATGVATVANGVVTAITITNPGTGYTSVPLVRIASPPFNPKLGIETSKVYVRMSIVLGRKYQLEASADLNTWNATGPAFIAQDEDLVQEFDVNQVGRYFRINQVP